MAQLDSGTAFSVTANNATSAVASQAGAAGKTHFLYVASGSSDKAAAKIIIKDGTTVIWQDRISGTSALMYYFPVPLRITTGALVSATVDGTAECNANIAGVTISS